MQTIETTERVSAAEPPDPGAGPPADLLAPSRHPGRRGEDPWREGLMRAITASLVMLDSEGRIASASDGWRRLVADGGGDAALHGVGASLLDACATDASIYRRDAPRVAVLLRDVMSGVCDRGALVCEVLTAEGTPRRMALQVSAVKVGDKRCVLVVHHGRDIDPLLRYGGVHGASERERTLLIVDDDENIIASLRRLLRRDGYRILTASSGQAGLALLADHEVDVIISDQRMPNMTGVEFLRRAKIRRPETVRMVLSGYTELQSITDAVNEGAIYKFLLKPWDDELLREHVNEAFRRKELADENARLNEELQHANVELSEMNARLAALVQRVEERAARDATSLDLVREVLQHVPTPVIGVDSAGMVVFLNLAADTLFGGSILLGDRASQTLPESLNAVLDAQEAEARSFVVDGEQLTASWRPLGDARAPRGRLLIVNRGEAGR